MQFEELIAPTKEASQAAAFDWCRGQMRRLDSTPTDRRKADMDEVIRRFQALEDEARREAVDAIHRIGLL